MEFRVLGPLEVLGDDGPVSIRGRLHPKLLVMLLDEANRIVPVDRLITGLWEDLPPDSARQQVHNVIGGLRKQLGRDGARLRTVGAGYRLEVADRELDVLRCREREARARELRSERRLSEAAAELSAALDEWRGPVLAGLEGRMVEATARRFEEYRLALIENRIDIDLDLGAGDSMITELRQLTAAEPLRQRFTEQLMLASHRSGRTPEALRAYRNPVEQRMPAPFNDCSS
jgi:DNA-binding SARP family transcriptional activator